MPEKNDWIEIDGRLFEVVAVIGNYYKIQEVLYNQPTLKLQYGKPFMIASFDINLTEGGNYEWEKYLIPFVNTLPGITLEGQ